MNQNGRHAALEIDLAEFARLREEITARMQLQSAIVAAELAALGTGATVVEKLPDVLLGLAAISSFLWLLWLDHAEQIQWLAEYIGCRLAPRLQTDHPHALAWESFVRSEASGTDPGEVRPTERRARFLESKRIGRYVALLFGGVPVSFVVLYTGTLHRFQWPEWALLTRVLGTVLVLMLAIAATSRYAAYRGLVREVRQRIRSAGPSR